MAVIEGIDDGAFWATFAFLALAACFAAGSGPLMRWGMRRHHSKKKSRRQQYHSEGSIADFEIWDNIMHKAAEILPIPMRWIFTVAAITAAIACARSPFEQGAAEFEVLLVCEKLGLIVLIWQCSKLANCLVDLLKVFWEAKAAQTEGKVDDMVVPLLVDMLKNISSIFFGVLALDNVGIDANTLIASVSCSAVALAFAVQDYIKAFFGVLVIFTSHPFEVGDQIRVGERFGSKMPDSRGAVVNVSLRYTTIIGRYTGEHILIPNSEFLSAGLTNVSRRESIRMSLRWAISLSKEELDNAAEIDADQSANGDAMYPDQGLRRRLGSDSNPKNADHGGTDSFRAVRDLTIDEDKTGWLRKSSPESVVARIQHLRADLLKAIDHDPEFEGFKEIRLQLPDVRDMDAKVDQPHVHGIEVRLHASFTAAPSDWGRFVAREADYTLLCACLMHKYNLRYASPGIARVSPDAPIVPLERCTVRHDISENIRAIMKAREGKSTSPGSTPEPTPDMPQRHPKALHASSDSSLSGHNASGILEFDDPANAQQKSNPSSSPSEGKLSPSPLDKTVPSIGTSGDAAEAIVKPVADDGQGAALSGTESGDKAPGGAGQDVASSREVTPGETGSSIAAQEVALPDGAVASAAPAAGKNQIKDALRCMQEELNGLEAKVGELEQQAAQPRPPRPVSRGPFLCPGSVSQL